MTQQVDAVGRSVRQINALSNITRYDYDALGRMNHLIDALQTLAANKIFAALQYSCTDTAIPLITNGNTLTAQGNIVESTIQTLQG